jgi:hypothetical protein
MQHNPKVDMQGQRKSRRTLVLLALGLVVAILLPLTIGFVAYSGGDSSSPDTVSAKTPPGGTTPTPAVDVTPNWPLCIDDLVCSINSTSTSHSQTTVTCAWYKNSVLQTGLTGNTVDSSYTAKGETWKCVVTTKVVRGGRSGRTSTQSDEVTICNSPPTAPAVVVTPELPLAGDALAGSIATPSSDADGDNILYTFAWYKDGVLQPQFTGSAVDAGYAAKGQTWKCLVTASDGTDSSAGFDEVTVQNEPPKAPVVDITPDQPVTTDSLQCSIVVPSSDPDEDPLTYTYAWYKDDILQTDLTRNTVDASYTARGEVWKCVVTVTDGAGGSAGSFDEVTISGSNNPPTAPVVAISPDLPTTADSLLCSLVVLSSDEDGDVLTYTYLWYKNGVVQTNLTGNTVDASYTTKGELWECVVTVTDGAGGSAGSFDDVTIHNSTPTAPVADVTPDLPVTNNNLVCSVNVASSDADGDTITYTYAWYKDSVLQTGLTSNTVNASYTARGETWKCVLTAGDGTGASAEGFDEVTIHNSPPTAPAVDVTPDEPEATDSLACSITTPSSDADGDTVTYTYAWYKNSVLQTELTGNTVDASYTDEGQTWRCVVTASDGVGGSASSYDRVAIPSAVSGPRNPGYVNSLLTYGVAWRYLTNATDRAHLIKACQDFGINTVEVNFDATLYTKLSDEPSSVATGIAAFDAVGIQVWACWNSNSTGWDDDTDGHTWHEFFEAVLNWNKDHPTAKFAGLQFDLEPSSGSTTEQHRVFLEGVYATMQTMRGFTVDDTETLESQELTVAMFCDPRWGGTVCASAWAQVVSQLDVVEIEHYRWGGSSYAEGIDYSLAYTANALAVVINQGRYFTCTLSCDELPKTIEASDPYGSRFNLGREGYEQAMQDYADYYNAHYPDNFVGFTQYFDAGGFVYWFNIDSVTSSPSGTFAPGDTMTINYQTRRRTDRYSHRVFGIQMELKDSAGAVWKVNQIVDLVDGQTTSRTISLTVPAGVADGAATARLTMWAVGWYNESSYDILYYSNYSGYQSQLLAMTMDELAAATTGPNGTLTGKRSTFFMLQATDWQGGITLT